nr:hypothetical protein [Chitinophagaceae bacterium]
MKNKIIFLIFIILYALNTNAQISRQAKMTNVNRIEKASRYKIPESLVYVIPYSEYAHAKYTGRINRQTSDTIMMRDLQYDFNWTLAKLSEDRFSFVGPEEVTAVKQVYICKPQGPIVNPSDQNLKQWDYAALCLSDGHIIYVQINAPFRLNKNSTNGSGYLQFYEYYDKGRFHTIQVSWDVYMQKWIANKEAYETNAYLKNGATIEAIYSYYDLTTEFFDHTKTK